MTINNLLNEGHKIQFGNMNFENANLQMLIVNENNFEEHLSKHAAAIAYYGSLYKTALREVNEFDDYFKYRYNEMFSDCSRILQKTTKSKPLIKEIEATIQTKYEDELKQLSKRGKILQETKDSAEMFYEAWKTKSYVLNNYTHLVTAGLIRKDVVEEKNVEKRSKLLSLINKKDDK